MAVVTFSEILYIIVKTRPRQVVGENNTPGLHTAKGETCLQPLFSLRD